MGEGRFLMSEVPLQRSRGPDVDGARALPFSPFLSHTHTPSLSHILSFTHTLSLCLSLQLSLFLSLSHTHPSGPDVRGLRDSARRAGIEDVLTLSPSQLLTLSPSCPFTLSPSHPCTLAPSHPLNLAPSHPLTLSPSRPFTLSQSRETRSERHGCLSS
jgi:hypothetical protein